MKNFDLNDPKKEICNELARQLSREDGIRAFRLLQMADFIAASKPKRGTGGGQSVETGAPRPISVWQPQNVEGEEVFVRPDPPILGDFYATRKVLKKKAAASPCRICMFGESVAAGYLHAPHLTPAQVLEQQLGFLAGADTFEVIDLARVNENLQSLLSTLQSAAQLKPDVLVFFMGNNWNLLENRLFSPYIPSVQARQRFGQALRQLGIQGPIAGARQQIGFQAKKALGKIAAVAEAAKAHVILVIPEINLADWETPQPVSWLPGDGIERWYSAYDRALQLLEEGSYREAVSAAQEMIVLDGGTCPTPHRIQVRAHLGLGDAEQALEASVREVDSTHYVNLCFLSGPQANSQARQLLEQEAQEHGFSCLDLRPIFAEHIGSPLPGRRLFLDYCHLTAEGMKVAMSAVACEVVQQSDPGCTDIRWQSLVDQTPDPQIPPEAQALAAFGAAVHSAHRLLTTGPKAPILEWWCQKALEASENIAKTMLDFVASRLAPCPAVMTEAQQRNLESAHHLQIQHGWRYDYMDVEMIEAIRNVLERAGDPSVKDIDRNLLELRGLPSEGVDLVYPAYFHWEPLARFYPDALGFKDMTWRACYRAPWRDSSFCLVCDVSRDVELSITTRLPLINGLVKKRRGELEIRVNSKSIATLEASQNWVRKTLRVSRDDLRKGINRLTIRWPLPPPIGEEALAEAICRLENGVEADLHPVFGEIFSLFARPC